MKLSIRYRRENHHYEENHFGLSAVGMSNMLDNWLFVKQRLLQSLTLMAPHQASRVKFCLSAGKDFEMLVTVSRWLSQQTLTPVESWGQGGNYQVHPDGCSLAARQAWGPETETTTEPYTHIISPAIEGQMLPVSGQRLWDGSYVVQVMISAHTLMPVESWGQGGNYQVHPHGCSLAARQAGGSFTNTEFTSISTSISYYNHYKLWDEITSPFPNLNVATIKFQNG